jgi:hypothetical protein
MRACARVALASVAVCASIGLSGCAAIEELKETFLRWVESQKLPSERSVSAGELPEAPVALPEKTPMISPEKRPKEPSKRPPQPKDAARNLQRQTVVLPPKKPPIPDSTEGVRPEAPRGNPRRLSARRGGCLVVSPKHRHPDVFHAKIGHRITGLPARAMTHLGDVGFRHVCTHKAHIRARRGYKSRDARSRSHGKEPQGCLKPSN